MHVELPRVHRVGFLGGACFSVGVPGWCQSGDEDVAGVVELVGAGGED